MLFSGPSLNYHTDRDAARALGFPDIVVQGMLPICLVSELLTRDFGEGWLAGGKMDVRLVNVLWANEAVAARAEVIGESHEAGRTRLHLETWVEKEDQTKVIVGTASALASATAL
jgi:acyl dehydratase